VSDHVSHPYKKKQVREHQYGSWIRQEAHTNKISFSLFDVF
jgi:hypothetical protein